MADVTRRLAGYPANIPRIGTREGWLLFCLVGVPSGSLVAGCCLAAACMLAGRGLPEQIPSLLACAVCLAAVATAASYVASILAMTAVWNIWSAAFPARALNADTVLHGPDGRFLPHPGHVLA